MTFAWIAAEKAEFPITRLCRTLHVSPSGFYASRARPESTHARDDRRLRVLVRASFAESKQRYGSPRVHEDLLEQHEHVSRKRVVRLMQEAGLQARLRKRYKVTTMSDPDQPVAANLLDRDFTAAAPNQRWVGDTTEFVIGGSGKLYLAAILDLFSRFIVGWAVSASNDRQVTIKALQMALPSAAAPTSTRPAGWGGPQCEQRPHHSDAPGLHLSGLHLCERGLSRRARHARYYVQHEPPRQLLRL